MRAICAHAPRPIVVPAIPSSFCPGSPPSSAAPRPKPSGDRTSSGNWYQIEYSLARLAGTLQIDPTLLELDKPLPDPLPLPVNANHTMFQGTVNIARRGNLTVRQLIRALGGGVGHRIIVGTPEQIADDIEAWFKAGAADGFNLMPDVLPSGLETFVDTVVPILQSRGLFRTEYAGSTLRDHFGLQRPVSRYAKRSPEVASA
ncbi:hypothetical protein ACVWZR_010071 [Bradyrhizobium sp. i1.3.1]